MTLRRYVPLAVLAAVLALVAVAGVLAWRQYDDGRLVATNEVRARLLLVSGDSEAYFKGDIAALEAMARSQVVIDADRQQMLAYFRRVAESQKAAFPGGISWIDARGISRVSSAFRTLAPPVDVSDRAYFRQVVSRNRPFVSDGLVSRRNGSHEVVIAVPTHDARGAVNGVLTGAFVLASVASNGSAVALEVADLELYDREGQSIRQGFSHPENRALLDRIQARPRGGVLTDTRGLDGRSGHVVAWASSPTPGWSIVFDRPGSEVFAAARRALILDIALIAGLALLVIALIGWMAQRARREVRRQSEHFAREHDIAVRLQRSMLPASLPRVDGMDVARRYRAGVAGVEVGGDWYDVVARADGFVHAIVGDVAGRGIDAATLMGQLRNGFHAYAYDHGSPAEVLRRMVRLVPEGAMATAVCLTLDPYTGDLRYSSAGHPPSVVLDGATGVVSLLDVGGSPPLGYVAADSLADSRIVLGANTTVVAYTDGLVERRTASIDVGIARLSAVLARDSERTADELAGAILAEVGDAPSAEEDDVALLVLRLVGAPRRFDVEIPSDPHLLGPLRRRVRRWLALRGLDEPEREDAVIAINEACSNSIEHGYDQSEGPIRLTVTHSTRQLEIVVHDRGRWRERPDPDPARGRGLAIIQNIMRHADVAFDANGTTVTMVQELAR